MVLSSSQEAKIRTINTPPFYPFLAKESFLTWGAEQDETADFCQHFLQNTGYTYQLLVGN